MGHGFLKGRRSALAAQRSLQARIDGAIARGLDALERGEPIPAHVAGLLDLGGAANTNVSWTAGATDLVRVAEIARLSGINIEDVITSALRLGWRPDCR